MRGITAKDGADHLTTGDVKRLPREIETTSEDLRGGGGGESAKGGGGI